MKWLTLDLAAESGWAAWEKSELVATGIVYEHTKKKTEAKPWALEYNIPDQYEEPVNGIRTFATEEAAWRYIKKHYDPKIVVVEEIRGGFTNTNISLAETRGAILSYLEVDRRDKKRVVRINSNTWRSEIKHMVPATDKWQAGKWPKSPLNKEAAVEIVYRRYGLEVNHNAADSVCLGLSYLGGA